MTSSQCFSRWPSLSWGWRGRDPTKTIWTLCPPWTPGLDDAWDDLVALVGDALSATIMGHAIGHHEELHVPRMEGIRATLLSNGIHIPTEKDEWLDWWRRLFFLAILLFENGAASNRTANEMPPLYTQLARQKRKKSVRARAGLIASADQPETR